MSTPEPPGLDADYRLIAEKLAQLREDFVATRRHHKLNLRQIAEASGVSLNSLSRFERGSYPNLGHVIALVRWLADMQEQERATATTCFQADTCTLHPDCDSYVSCIEIEVQSREVR
jgi:transcriptional regulator with XRE-family HTH domain